MSGIDNAKQVAGWQPQNARASCRNCKHKGEQAAYPGSAAYRIYCTKHSFITQQFAICDNWTDAVGVRG